MFRFENGYLDDGLSNLRMAIELIDPKLQSINSLLNDGFSEGLAEQADYLVGLGFAAMQQYQDSVASWVRPKITELLEVGPILQSGVYQARLIHAAANWWKHESALYKDGFRGDTADPILATVNINPFAEYTMVNVLHSLSADGLLLRNVLPALEKWRNEVLQSYPRLESSDLNSGS